MTGPTHLIGGIVSLTLPAGFLIIIGVHPSLEVIGVAALGAMLGAMLPDLDAKESQIKGFTIALNTAPGRRRKEDAWNVSPFALLAQILHPLLGHRTLTHSLMGLLLLTAFVTLPVSVFLSPAVGVSLTLGYASHLLLDACTPHGIPLLYPNRRRFHLLPRQWQVSTGSAQEGGVFLLLAAVTLLILVYELVNAATNTSG